MCPRIFGQDPEPHLKRQAIRLRCPVHPDRPAQIVPELQARVNHEIFYFSDREALERFRRDPLRYCGTLTDPVSRARFKPTSRSPHLEYRGQPYFFVDRLSLRSFQAIPDSFAVRKGA